MTRSYPSGTYQCRGVTQKGIRCKKSVSDGDYCHYHLDQDPNTDPKTDPKTRDPSKGASKGTSKGASKGASEALAKSSYASTKGEAATSANTSAKGEKGSSNSSAKGASLKAPSPKGSTPSAKGAPTKSTSAPPYPKASSAKGSFAKGSSAKGSFAKGSFAKASSATPGSDPFATRPHSTGHIPTRPDVASHATRPGFIYVYTLSSLAAWDNAKSKPDASWLKVRNIPNTASRNKDKWLPFDHKSHSYTLIKVGMTTQTVSKRIKQWENQCQHSLTCLYPSESSPAPSARLGSPDPLSLSPSASASPLMSLVSRFKSLRVESSSSSSSSSPSPQYRSLRPHDMGFYVPHSIMSAETQIHHILRKKYGSGDVLCTACKKNDTIVKDAERDSSLLSLFKSHKPKHQSFQEGTFNIHVEWFLIPKSDLEFVYSVIDSVCVQYYG